jgi:hypothetical protein
MNRKAWAIVMFVLALALSIMALVLAGLMIWHALMSAVLILCCLVAASVLTWGATAIVGSEALSKLPKIFS